MAELKPKSRQHKVKAPQIFDLWERAESQPTPATFIVGRDVTFRLAEVERNLFTDIEEKDSGNYIVSGLTRKVTGRDFYAFSMGVGQILSNQSQQMGNKETNSGLTQQIAPKILDQTGHTYYGGEIVATLNELCWRSYGERKPSTRQREAMATLIDTLHSTPVTITFPNGDIIEANLCVKMGRYIRKKDGAIYYHLILNPIFCEGVKRNYSEFPQDVTMRLTAVSKTATEAHYRLLLLLSRQIKSKPFVRNIDVLLEDLGLTEAHRKDRERTEKQLLTLFEDMKKPELGIITSYKVGTTTIRRKERITKVTFHLNPNFVRKSQADK